MNHVTLSFGPLAVPATRMPFLCNERQRVFRVSWKDASVLQEALASRSTSDLSAHGDLIILNTRGTYLTHEKGTYLVHVVSSDLKTNVVKIDIQEFMRANGNAQWRLSLYKRSRSILIRERGNPTPQSLTITSFGTKLSGRYGITGVMHGLSARNVVDQVANHNKRDQFYQLECEGMNNGTSGN